MIFPGSPFESWDEKRRFKMTKPIEDEIAAVLKRVEEDPGVILELGTGIIERGQGWITMDNKQSCDIKHDLCDPFPFPDNTFPNIYCSHVLEHFYYPELVELLREVYRILKAGGMFSLCVPDASIYIKAYCNPGDFKADHYCRYRRAYHFFSKIDYINYMAYMDGHHKIMFDRENLPGILRFAGFVKVRQRDFEPEVDIRKRDYESIYFLAEKESGS
jgi:predicted SAM-dependent methyltransferase